MKAKHCGGKRVRFHFAFSLVALAVVGVLSSLVVVSKARGKVGEGGRSDQCAVFWWGRELC